MKAVKRFKDLLFSKRPELMEGIFGRSSRFVAPPGGMQTTNERRRVRSTDSHDRKPIERVLATEGVHRHELPKPDHVSVLPDKTRASNTKPQGAAPESVQTHEREEHEQRQTRGSLVDRSRSQTPGQGEHAKGQAHDPLTDLLFLDIGASSEAPPAESPMEYVLSESPGAVDINVYETAYEEEIQKILARRGKAPTIYLTRRVEGNKAIREHESVIGNNSDAGRGGLAGLVQRAKEQMDKEGESGEEAS